MLPDRYPIPGPLTYESGALPIALRGPATIGLTIFIASVFMESVYSKQTVGRSEHV